MKRVWFGVFLFCLCFGFFVTPYFSTTQNQVGSARAAQVHNGEKKKKAAQNPKSDQRCKLVSVKRMTV